MRVGENRSTRKRSEGRPSRCSGQQESRASMSRPGRSLGAWIITGQAGRKKALGTWMEIHYGRFQGYRGDCVTREGRTKLGLVIKSSPAEKYRGGPATKKYVWKDPPFHVASGLAENRNE